MNENPIANDDSFTLPENSVDFVLDVLANDSCYPDVDETLTVYSTTTPTCGTVTLTSSNILFTPTTYYFGSCQFEYTISDGNGGFATATVDLTVTNGMKFINLILLTNYFKKLFLFFGWPF